jgi:uncharacterized protein YjiS (DUF1127 family)
MKPAELTALSGALVIDTVQNPASVLTSARRFWRGTLDRVRRAALERAASAQFQAMSDRQLADIGLCRNDMPNAVGREGFPLVFDHAEAWSVTFRATHLRS